MKRYLTLTVALTAIACAGGCSPTISAWADRGVLGCDNEQTAADAWRDLALGHIDVQQSASIADVFVDIRSVSAGRVIDPDGEPVAMDDAWLTEAHTALEATLLALARRRGAIDEMHARHTANIASTRESLTQIRRLNTAWASLGRSELPAQVARLIAELQRQRTQK